MKIDFFTPDIFYFKNSGTNLDVFNWTSYLPTQMGGGGGVTGGFQTRPYTYRPHNQLQPNYGL